MFSTIKKLFFAVLVVIGAGFVITGLAIDGAGIYAVIGVILWLPIVLDYFGARRRGRDDAWGEDYQYYWFGKSTAIAACPKRKSVKLQNGKITKTYSIADIRNWESNLQSGGMGSHMGAANIGVGIDNARASGLFVTVKDVDHAVWRIAMLDPKVQARWMEIMRQVVNESDVPANMQIPN